jgi:alkanesulfonate monooxygenase SsuD/methylene tetrahydromethanopterin reductase-like flavin-dependent oxidoreductase (luciferase family)
MKSNFEGWTTIVALFAEVDQIRMGHLVTCNLFRHPSILAKMSSMVDVISKGRLEFGIGAGWYEEEAVAYGIPFPSPGERVGRLDEAVQIIRAMWTKRSVSFDGTYYTLRNAVNEPKPLQRPHPPIWIGGNKEKMLRIVARYADKWNPNCPIEELSEKMVQLQRACLEVDRDFESIEKTFAMDIFIGSEREVEKIRRRLTSLGSPFDFRTGVAGTVEDVVERVQTLRNLGVTYFSFNIPNVSEFEPLCTVAKEVIPRIE